MASVLKHFTGSFIVTIVGLAIAFLIGYFTVGTASAGLEMAFICFVLGVLEVSLSFDNAVVNASVLTEMTPLWRRRFLTWGIVVAVFGMRIVFPLAIVGFTTDMNPWQALLMAATRPEDYAAVMRAAHIPVAAFGGSFLLMVALTYFFDANKETHWLKPIEKLLQHLGKLESSALGLALVLVASISTRFPMEQAIRFLTSSIAGLVVFVVVNGASRFLKERDIQGPGLDLHKASLAMFIYLEVLDASFSFDGVVGAFAITNNLFVIAVGLGIGAMFVRSLTVLLVERGTLTEFRYLEHGAFWAIGILAALMFAGTFVEIPEVVTGLTGAALIGLSLYSSIRYNKKCGTETVSVSPAMSETKAP